MSPLTPFENADPDVEYYPPTLTVFARCDSILFGSYGDVSVKTSDTEADLTALLSQMSVPEDSTP